MRKITPLVGISLSFVLAGCQTPLFSDGLPGSLFAGNSRKDNAETETRQTAASSKPQLGGRGWRNAASRAAEQESNAQITSLNNVERLREFLAKGNAAMQSGQYDNARIQYETILSLEPQHATAHHMLGRINDMARKFDAAERHYLAALSSNREDGYLLSDLGYSYLQQGRLDEARQYLTQAITREPDLAVAKVNLAAVYAYNGDQRGALAWLREVGSEQQAQETLASITSKPAPWVLNGASGTIASAADKYSINKDGQVLDANGQPLTTWEEVQAAMKEIRQQGSQARRIEQQLQEFQERERINRAMAQQSEYDRNSSNSDDASLNRRMQAISQASGSRSQDQLNSRPIYIGPPESNQSSQQPGPIAFNGAPTQAGNGAVNQWPSNAQQHAFPNASGVSSPAPASQHDPYSGLLNPAGPTGFTQPSEFSHQQVPTTQPHTSGSTVPPQFPGTQALPAQTGQYASSSDPRLTGHQSPHVGAPHAGGLYGINAGPGASTNSGQNGAVPNWNGAGSGRPLHNQHTTTMQTPSPNSTGAAPGFNPHAQQYSTNGAMPVTGAAQQPAANQLPVDQYGNPIQQPVPGTPGWNAPPSGQFPNQRSTAPNPNYFGQGAAPGNVTPQAGSFTSSPQHNAAGQYSSGQSGQYPVGNSHYQQHSHVSGHSPQIDSPYSGGANAGQQQIQQLSFNDQAPMAQIDRGQTFNQYSEADRQATRLGMAAGFGPLAPITTETTQTARSSRPLPDQVQSNYAPQSPAPQNYWPPENARQEPATSAPANARPSSPVNQPGQFRQQPSSVPNQEFPGAVPATSRQLPGQSQFQGSNQSVSGPSMAGQTGGQDPQTAQSWLRMPPSQADVTMPAAFTSTTQPIQQQSQNYQRPDVTNQAWQNGALASPTMRPEFGQPHMTEPFLRTPEAQNGQPGNTQSVQTASWPSPQ